MLHNLVLYFISEIQPQPG